MFSKISGNLGNPYAVSPDEVWRTPSGRCSGWCSRCQFVWVQVLVDKAAALMTKNYVFPQLYAVKALYEN